MPPSTAEIKKRLAVFNFGLSYWVLCPVTLKKKWRYCTHPINGRCGASGHFDTKEQLYKYVLELEYTDKCIKGLM